MSIPIRIRKETVEELKKLKIHYRETYDDVIRRLIEYYKNSMIKGLIECYKDRVSRNEGGV
jgi:predicted CopG family antitoxin